MLPVEKVRFGESVFNMLVLRVLDIIVLPYSTPLFDVVFVGIVPCVLTHWRLVLQIDHV